MSESGISQEILAFIIEHIDSVVQLEVLLMLHNAPGTDWRAADVARELRIEPAGAATQLAELCTRGLLSCTETGTDTYRYSPRTPEIERSVARLATVYEERRVSVINLIYTKPVDKLKSFSEAFRFRKESDA